MSPFEKLFLTGVLLASLVFVHEFGHFAVAKLLGVKVLRFSIGMGPKLFGFTWGETEYWLSALPIGGYVKMAGDDPTEPLTGADAGRGFLEQAPWKRAAIAVAGPALNLLFPVLVFFAAFYAKSEDYSARLGYVEPERAAWKAGLRPGDRIVSVDGVDVRYFNDLRDLITPKYDRDVLVLFERGGKVQTTHLVPERVEETDAVEKRVRGIIGVGVQAPAAVIGIDAADSAAAKAGLKSFDRIVKIAGQPVDTFVRAQELAAAQTAPFEVEAVRDVANGPVNTWQVVKATLPPRSGVDCGRLYCGFDSAEMYLFAVDPGTPADKAGLERGDKLVSIDGQPLFGWATVERVREKAATAPMHVKVLRDGQPLEVDVTQLAQADELVSGMTHYVFGARYDERPTSFTRGEKIPFHIAPGAALSKSMHKVPEAVRTMTMGIAKMFVGDISVKAVGGPGAIYQMAGNAAEAGSEYFLEAMALFSINLGIVNLLPIPILDGFHILSAAWEAIRRRPLSLKARLVANYVGLVLLLGLMGIALRNDVVSFLTR